MNGGVWGEPAAETDRRSCLVIPRERGLRCDAGVFYTEKATDVWHRQGIQKKKHLQSIQTTVNLPNTDQAPGTFEKAAQESSPITPTHNTKMDSHGHMASLHGRRRAGRCRAGMNEEGTGRGRRSWGDERTGGEGAGVREGDESG